MRRRIRRAKQAEFPIRAVIAGVLAMLLIAVVAVATTWIVGKRLRTITSSQIAVLTASARLQHQRDIAELSVHAAIATGDPTHAARYARIQPQMRDTLSKLKPAIVLRENRETFVGVERAEDELARLQLTVLQHAIAGRQSEARRIVADPHYVGLVRTYRNGLAAIHDRSQTYIAATRRETNRYLAVNLATSLAALLLLAVAWLVVVRPARQWAYQLADARRRAENATRAKSDFLAVMSHEIRTPLNSIIGFADLLNEDRGLTPEQHRQVSLIQDAGTMLLTVVNDLLDFSKIEAGGVELVPEPFAVESLIDGCVSIVRGIADAKGLEIRVLVDRWIPPYLLGDESRLRQVLLNLLNNAVKFTATGWVELKVEKIGPHDGLERLRVTITDTGPGIEQDRQQQLFRPFVQADASITRRYGGTGLGLTISKRLIELMGGRIGFESKAGFGSAFWFSVSLPRAARPAELDATPKEEAKANGARILLTEDLAMNQELATAMLTRAGYQVEVAGDGEAALRAVQAKSYDLVLMDIQMPKMDGITATRLIRALPAPAGEVPIVAMTANVLPNQVREYLDAGMNGHIAKPVRQPQLHAAIAAVLSSRSAKAAGEQGPARGFDAATYDEVAEMLPADRLRGHVLALIEAVGEVGEAAEALEADGGDSDPDGARRTLVMGGAHKIVSQAGMLGLLRLSDAARALEEAVRAGEGVAAARAAFRGAARDPEIHLQPLLTGESAD